jgi:hypothetical protein
MTTFTPKASFEFANSNSFLKYYRFVKITQIDNKRVEVERTKYKRSEKTISKVWTKTKNNDPL